LNPWIAVAGAGAIGTWIHGSLIPNSPLFGPVIGHGPPDTRTIYLTFDDGPNPGSTEEIVTTLASRGVPASFFCVGRHVEMFPTVVRRVATAGFEVGNHTRTHHKLHLAGPKRVREEIESAHAAILKATGTPPVSFRAPHGYRSPFVTATARAMGYTVFGWTIGVWDSSRPGAEVIRRRVRKALRPGAILLLHDGDGRNPHGDRTQTARALPGIIADVLDAGYSFGKLGDLRIRPAEPARMVR
jgi:peptidoglycan/xylan/chitin deacetylase (PgdA/CDA1 family)